MKNVFDSNDTKDILDRINKLTPATEKVWGTMTIAQMLAHCNITYELVYDDKHPKATGLKRFLLKLFVKSTVVNDKPYPKNGRTAPVFIVDSEKKFETEKKRLIEYIQKTQQLGTAHFEGKESNSFGALTSKEWNAMFYKHLDHHLSQFGV